MLKRRLLADGGMMQEGGTTDPVSGNNVPTGSLKEEVRDDVDAKLSPGEFVLPADVVRYIGLERLMKLRDEAKQGLQRMNDVGQMGNAESAPKGDEAFQEDDSFDSDIDEIMSDVDNEEMTKQMAAGGFISGSDLTKASKNPAIDVRYFKNAEGRVIFITHINGKPMTPVPNGYTQTDSPTEQLVGSEAEKKADADKAAADKAAADKATSATETNVGADMGAATGAGTSGPATPTGFTNSQARAAGLALTAITGIPVLAPVVAYINNMLNKQAETAKADEKMSAAKETFRGLELAAQSAEDEAAKEAADRAQVGESEQAAVNAAVAANAAESMQAAQEADTTAANAAAAAAAAANAQGVSTEPAAPTGDSGASSDNSDSQGDAASAGVGGGGMAKGGFVAKKAKPNVIAKSKKGLASRK